MVFMSVGPAPTLWRSARILGDSTRVVHLRGASGQAHHQGKLRIAPDIRQATSETVDCPAMRSASPVRITDPDICVETVLGRVGRRLVVGLPVGIGKPNLLANAFVRRAAADPSIQLTIVTALSLKLPRGSSDLERRYLAPLVRRVFGDYPELEYVRMLEERLVSRRAGSD